MDDDGLLLFRFIPTRVGNTGRGRETRSQPSVHPHTRGEHTDRIPVSKCCTGSSPHAWGTPLALIDEWEENRFIPTRVGNTHRSRGRCSRVPVHPHTRGEHPEPAGVGVREDGSSPHAWGTLRPAEPPSPGHRFIPTRVGNTASIQGIPMRSPVHPHTRGEHLVGEDDSMWINGSSPHAWGTRWGSRERFARNFGSSPHAWGTPHTFTVTEFEPRFIPTRVGNTSPETGWSIIKPVHPHTRGEHSW